MAIITPSFNPSTALATPGWPMVAVPMSNPIAADDILNDKTDGTVTADQTEALLQSGHSADRVV